jgi:hypothetical protein
MIFGIPWYCGVALGIGYAALSRFVEVFFLVNVVISGAVAGRMLLLTTTTDVDVPDDDDTPLIVAPTKLVASRPAARPAAVSEDESGWTFVRRANGVTVSAGRHQNAHTASARATLFLQANPELCVKVLQHPDFQYEMLDFITGREYEKPPAGGCLAHTEDRFEFRKNMWSSSISWGETTKHTCDDSRTHVGLRGVAQTQEGRPAAADRLLASGFLVEAIRPDFCHVTTVFRFQFRQPKPQWVDHYLQSCLLTAMRRVQVHLVRDK